MSENMVTILDKHPSGAFYVMQYDFFEICCRYFAELFGSRL